MSDESGEPEGQPYTVERDEKGRFRNSGNPAGRPFTIRQDPKLPAARRAAIFRVADRKAPVNIEGKVEVLTLFEANILRLGIAGANGNRVAAKDFLQMAMLASNVDLERRLANKLVTNRIEELELENAEMRKKYGVGQSPVVRLSKEEWAEFERQRERRYDDGSFDASRQEEFDKRWAEVHKDEAKKPEGGQNDEG